MVTVAPMMASTSQDRRSGCRATNRPNTGPEHIEPTTSSVISSPACRLLSPCPDTRNGKPHRRANTVPENCVLKWVHRPSRVPGCSHAARSWTSTRVRPMAVGGAVPGGASRIPISASTQASTPSEAMDR